MLTNLLHLEPIRIVVAVPAADSNFLTASHRVPVIDRSFRIDIRLHHVSTACRVTDLERVDVPLLM